MSPSFPDRHAVKMNLVSHKLFQMAARHVTVQDVYECCPLDPGGAGYIQEFAEILRSQTIPEGYSFNMVETIGLTQWGEPELEADPVKFRRFRLFTNAVGAAMCSGAKGPEDNLPPNYLAIGLLDDAWELGDKEVLGLLGDVFGEMHHRVVTARWCADDAPFLLLGQLLLALLGHHTVDVAQLTEELVRSERGCARRAGRGVFFWGATVFNQKHDTWRLYMKRAFQAPGQEYAPALELLRQGLHGVADPRVVTVA